MRINIIHHPIIGHIKIMHFTRLNYTFDFVENSSAIGKRIEEKLFCALSLFLTSVQAGLVSVGAVLHFMVRPVHSKYFDISDQMDAKEKQVDANNKILEK